MRFSKSLRAAIAITTSATALTLVAACSGISSGGPSSGGAQTHQAAATGGLLCQPGDDNYSWCSHSAAPQGQPSPGGLLCQPGDDNYSWCSHSAVAAVPNPVIDQWPGGPPPDVPGPSAPIPHSPGFCATKVDPSDTGIYIDPIDDEVVGTALSSCAGGLHLAPKRFMLVLTLYWHPESSSVWVPLGPPAQGVDIRIPYQYPAFIDSHVVTPCVTGASYFLKIQMPEGPNNLNYEGVPMPSLDENGEVFHADHLCHTH